MPIPLAPPVRIATRPSRRAITPPLSRTPFSARCSAFTAVRSDEFCESLELLLDEADGLLVLDLAGLVVDACRHIADEDFRLVHGHRVEKDHAAAQVVLHAAAAENAGPGGLHRHRLTGERLVGHPRYPVDGILQAARDRVIVFRRDEDDAVGGAHRLGELLHWL